MMSHDLDSLEMAKVTVTAFVEEEIKAGLKALADHERRSMSQMMAVLIEKAVDKAVEDGLIEKPSVPDASKAS